MVYVAIVEDDARAAQRLENHLNRFAAETEEQLHIEIFPDALQFLDGYAPVWQLVFMDIEMPNIDGLDAAKRLRAIDEGVQIVFVTNMAQYAIQGYEVRAMDFIVKPVEYGSFFMKMKRAIRYIRANSPKQITVKKDKAILRLDLREVRYIEVRGHNLEYHTSSGLVTARGKLSEAEQQLKADFFVRCNNCYLVNLIWVKEVHGLTANVGGEILNISRSRRPAFLAALSEFLGGGKPI